MGCCQSQSDVDDHSVAVQQKARPVRSLDSVDVYGSASTKVANTKSKSSAAPKVAVNKPAGAKSAASSSTILQTLQQTSQPAAVKPPADSNEGGKSNTAIKRKKEKAPPVHSYIIMDADGNMRVETFQPTELPEVQINLLEQSVGSVRHAAVKPKSGETINQNHSLNASSLDVSSPDANRKQSKFNQMIDSTLP
jgi:hypothetical protein